MTEWSSNACNCRFKITTHPETGRDTLVEQLYKCPKHENFTSEEAWTATHVEQLLFDAVLEDIKQELEQEVDA